MLIRASTRVRALRVEPSSTPHIRDTSAIVSLPSCARRQQGHRGCHTLLSRVCRLCTKNPPRLERKARPLGRRSGALHAKHRRLFQNRMDSIHLVVPSQTHHTTSGAMSPPEHVPRTAIVRSAVPNLVAVLRLLTRRLRFIFQIHHSSDCN